MLVYYNFRHRKFTIVMIIVILRSTYMFMFLSFERNHLLFGAFHCSAIAQLSMWHETLVSVNRFVCTFYVSLSILC